MNRKYTPYLFMLAVATFWLGLVFAMAPKTRSYYYNEFDMSYTDTEGVEQLNIELPDNNTNKTASISYNGIEIFYNNGATITIAMRGLPDEHAVKQLFVRNGNTLVLRPELNDGINTSKTDWIIRSITLPKHITNIHSSGIPLELKGLSKAEITAACKEDADCSSTEADVDDPKNRMVYLPRLNIQNINADIGIAYVTTDKLNIFNYHVYNKDTVCHSKPCSDGGTVDLAFEALKAKSLFVESTGGKIRLSNTNNFDKIELNVTPNVQIDLPAAALKQINYRLIPASADAQDAAKPPRVRGKPGFTPQLNFSDVGVSKN